MRPEDLSRIDDLFHAALERPPAERAAFLADACPDPDLRAGVLELVAAHEAAGEYFTAFADRLASGSALEIEAAAHQQIRIGAYRTLRVLGGGGMGTVYLAERADGQFDQQVALKLIRLGMDTEESRRRFLKERQIVARLDHPNIARLLDGGVTDEGRPYFVMEYIAGTPITRDADERGLSVAQRLRLFVAVGEAVQYAHRNLVVHRDVKPGNILVTADGTVKLLDFGIAKLLSDDTGDGAAEPTQAGERLLTPVYAAPEQIRGEPVTTATDVYGLGVVLYELLTGCRPHERKGLTPAGFERAVIEDEPLRPSAAVRDDRRRARELGGDLDTICLTALRKAPERRYGSAEQLVEDVRRYLAGLPVAARADTLAYRAGKFVRRHRVGVAASAAFVVLLAAFAGAMAVQSARTARERDKAERVASILVDLFEVADPSESRGERITAREVLDAAAGRIEQELAGQPELQAALVDVLGRVYQNLGLYGRARPLLEQALALRRGGAGASDREVAASLNALGEVLRLSGDYEGAEPVLREALPLDRAVERDGGPLTVRTLNNLGKVLQARGRYDEATAALDEALAMARARLGPDDLEVAEALNNLAAVRYARGDYAGAVDLFRGSLAIRARRLGADHPTVPAGLSNLATALGQLGDHDGAERAQREALGIYRRVLGPEHPRIATMLNNLAITLYEKKDYAAAEPLFRESLAMRRKLLEPAHPDVAQTLGNLGLLLQASGRLDEAEPALQEALDIRRSAFGPNHPLVAGAMNNLALLLQAKGEPRRAEGLFRDSQAILRERLGDSHPLVAMSVQNLAELLHQQGEHAAAEPLFREALELRRRLLPEGHANVADSAFALGRALAERGDFVAAEPLLVESLEIRERVLSDRDETLVETLDALADLYEASGREADAQRVRARAAGGR